MAKTPKGDVVQRKYLVSYIKRKIRRGVTSDAADALSDVLDWIAKQVERSKRTGGIGRR